MKRLLLAAILAMPLLAMAQNDAPTYYPQALSVPNVAEGGVSNGLAQIIDVRKQQNVALQINVTSSATTNAVYRISGSVDGTAWQTNRYVIGATATGVVLTNLAVAGVGYLRLDSSSTTGPGTLTNTFIYGLKISSP